MTDITYIDLILIFIGNIATFFQGFYIRRWNGKMILLSSLVMMLSSGLDLIIRGGIGLFFTTMTSLDVNRDLSAFLYVIIWWLAGFIMGGFKRNKTKIKAREVEPVRT